MKRAGPVLLACAMLACARAEDPVRATASNLASIRSGIMRMKVLSETADGTARAGFEVAGPFSIAGRSGLPVARLQVARIAGDRRVESTFISTGRRAFVATGGSVYALRDLDGLTLGPTQEGLGSLRIQEWLRDPRVEPGGRVDGVETERITGALDAVRAIQDLATVAGGALPALQGEEAARVRRAVRRASISLWTGAQDRLLRTLDIDVLLTVDERVAEALGPYGGARLRVSLAIEAPNRPVKVEEPEGAVAPPGSG